MTDEPRTIDELVIDWIDTLKAEITECSSSPADPFTNLQSGIDAIQRKIDELNSAIDDARRSNPVLNVRVHDNICVIADESAK